MSKILAFSDVHIGFENTNYPAFNKFLDSVAMRTDIDKIVMVGDILDLWRIDYNGIKSDHVYNDAFVHLQSTIDELADRGIETVYCLGNHCYMAESVVGDDLNVVYKHSYVYENVLYRHGWVFDVAQRFMIFNVLITPSIYEIITRWFPAIYQRFCRKPSEILSEDRSTSPWIDNIHTKASEFVSKMGIPYIVIGHTHSPLIRENVTDCGDWIDSLSWCEINDGIPTLYKWRDMEMNRD